MIIFLLCKAQNLRIMNYLKTFATKQKWNRIVEIGVLYLIIFTKPYFLLLSLQRSLFSFRSF
jgi:hypothetical protein